ncbi:MAG: GtrA family protein [Ruminococcus sp.]|nr:GtrA family protein [Ruminococcus sp.]
MKKVIAWVIGKLPKSLQKLWYDHESVWMYIIIGGLTTVVSLIFQVIPTSIFTSMHLAAWLNTFLATTISWIAAVTFAFFTNKRYVFKSNTVTRAAFWHEFFMFYAARFVTYFLELAIMELGNHFFATVDGSIVTWRSFLVKVVAQVVILTINYIFSKLIVFKKDEKTDEKDVPISNE